MRALNLGTYAGIPVKVHWTFGLMFFYVLYIGYTQGMSLSGTGIFSIYVLGLFFCVILHEYGHALTARRYGIETVDIIISPIGGLARLKDIPKKPIQELLVAIAGPLVNLVIAIILLGILLSSWDIDYLLEMELFQEETMLKPEAFLSAFCGMNFVLFFFNLIPAFPMDGGRILRSLLSIPFSRYRATTIAAFIGQSLAIGLFVFGLVNGMYIYTFISLFVFVTARQENNMVKLQHILENTPAHHIMSVNYPEVHLPSPMSEIVKPQLNSEQNYIAKNAVGEIIGIIPKEYLAERNDETLETLISDNYVILSTDTNLLDVFNTLNRNGLSLVILNKNGQPQGVIDRRIISDYIKSNPKV